MMAKRLTNLLNVKNCLNHAFYRFNSTVRVRFAPSPTGVMHLGGIRTALFNYLYALKHNGTFILRIEDTDKDRTIPGTIESIEETLVWSGIVPHEGPSFGGNYGPYIQSQRLDIYKEMVNQLLNTGKVYRCFCSETRLNLLRKEALKNRETPRYDNRCRMLTQAEIDEKLSKGTPFTVRLKLKDGPLTFNDLIYGPITIDLSLNECDPIIYKSDSFPTYHLANVIDDHHMGISHVLRGVEWQLSTPKHLMLYDAFNWEPPLYGHLPLILNKDGTKLSKRNQNITIQSYRDSGYFPKAIINYLTNIGGGFGKQIEDKIREFNDLAQSFDINKVNTISCKLDSDKMKLYNRLALHLHIHNDIKFVTQKLKGLVMKTFDNVESQMLDDDYIQMIIIWSKDRINTLEELITPEFSFVWRAPQFTWTIDDTESNDTESLLKQTITLIENHESGFEEETIAQHLRSFYEEKVSNVIKYNKFMKILRFSLSNLEKGPPIAEMMHLLGQKRTVQYLLSAHSYIINQKLENSK